MSSLIADALAKSLRSQRIKVGVAEAAHIHAGHLWTLDVELRPLHSRGLFSVHVYSDSVRFVSSRSPKSWNARASSPAIPLCDPLLELKLKVAIQKHFYPKWLINQRQRAISKRGKVRNQILYKDLADAGRGGLIDRIAESNWDNYF